MPSSEDQIMPPEEAAIRNAEDGDDIPDSAETARAVATMTTITIAITR